MFNMFVLLIAISIFMSAFVNKANYINSMWNGITYMLQLILFAWFCEYLDSYNQVHIGIKCLFSIIVIYCVVADLLMLISPYKIYYVDGSFSYMTIIGDKFSLTYLHLISVALYCSFIKNKDNKIEKIKSIILIVLTLLISIYTQCSTMIVGIILFTILLFYRKNTINILANPVFLLIYTLICNTILLLNDAVMNISVIKYFIENILHESIELTGRIGIYRSLSAVANINPILGVGLDNNYIVEALICAKKIQVVDKCFYHYVQRIGSLTKQYRKNLYLQYSKLCEYLYMYMDSRKVLDKYFNEYQHFYNCLMYLCIWNECNEFAPGNSKNKVNKVENILNKRELQESIHYLKTTDLKSFILKQLIKLRAAKILYNLKSR